MNVLSAKALRRMLVVLGLTVWGLMAGGCGSAGLMPGLANHEGGLPPRNAASISDVVGQARRGRLDAAGAKIPFAQRKVDKQAGPQTFVLVLQGKGQTPQGQEEGVRVELDRSSYSDGQVVLDGSAGREVWPIVASDRRGTLNEFDIIYVLALPNKGYRYLQLLGGSYKTDAGSFFGITGMLIEPAVGTDARQLIVAATIDFGHEFPKTPLYEQQIALTTSLLESARTRTRTLAGLEEIRVKSLQIEKLNIQPIPSGGAPARQAELNKLEVDLAASQTRHKDLVAELDGSWNALLSMRAQIEESYAAFVTTNRYTWFPQDVQEGYFSKWGQTITLDQEIRTNMAAFLPMSGNRPGLEADYAQLQDTITRIGNKARIPKVAS